MINRTGWLVPDDAEGMDQSINMGYLVSMVFWCEMDFDKFPFDRQVKDHYHNHCCSVLEESHIGDFRDF